MSFSINKAILLGNVTRDPEFKYTKSGHPIMTINLATNHSVKQGDGSYTDVPTFHRVIVFGKIGEWLSKNVFRGTKLYVDGRISTREYEDKNGQKQRSREIVAENVIPMTSQQIKNIESSRSNSGQEHASTEKDVPTDVNPDQSPENGKNDESINPDDIPF